MKSIAAGQPLAPSYRIELAGKTVDGDLLEAFIGAVIDRAALLVDTAELVFRDPTFQLQSHPLFDSGTSVRLFLSEAAGTAPVFDGEIVGGELRIGTDRPPVWKARAFHCLHRTTNQRRTRSFVAGPLVACVAEIARAYGWAAAAPDRQLPAMLQNERTDFALLRQLALRTGLDWRLDDGVLAFVKPAAHPRFEFSSHDIERLRVVRACVPAVPSAVGSWNPQERELIATEADEAAYFAQAPLLADRADADALASSLNRSRQEQANELRLSMRSPAASGQAGFSPGAEFSPGDRFRLVDTWPIFRGVWKAASIRHEFGGAGARLHVVAHPTAPSTLE